MFCLPVFGQTTAEDWFAKGIALMNQSKYDEAIQAFDKSIELDPQYAEAWRIKGAILNCRRKYDEALYALDKAVQIDPQDALAWANKGFSLYGKSDYNGALQAYDEANQLDPNLAEAWVGKGFTRLALKSHYSDEQPFDNAIDLDPNYGIAWIGNCFMGSRVSKWDSYTSLNNALRLNPKYSSYPQDANCWTDSFIYKECVLGRRLSKDFFASDQIECCSCTSGTSKNGSREIRKAKE